MSRKNYLLFPLLVFAFLLFDARVASACSCAPKSTVLEAYEWASVVVIVKAVAVEKSNPREGQADDARIKSTTMTVEKVFKGNLKVGAEMVFAQGGGADCIWTFSEESIGQEFLFYLRPLEKGAQVWLAGTCGRSSYLEYAADDLLYLENMQRVRGKTRLSGTLSFYQVSPVEGSENVYKRLGGLRVRVMGAKKSYELTTNKDGVYEIYDLPAGKYTIEPEIPAGWKLDIYNARGASDGDADADVEERPEREARQVLVKPGKHAYYDFVYRVASAVRGKVFDPFGNVMKGVCVKLIPAVGKVSSYFYKADCTKEAGTFELDEIPAGSYVLVVNDEGKISSSEPFKTFYYPNVFEREKAAVITISDGEIREGVNVHVPRMEELITITGVLLFSDGKPAADIAVHFKADKTSDAIEGKAYARTDERGRFAIKILKGLKGQLYGELSTYTGQFENCPQLESLIKKTGRDIAYIKTPVLAVQGETSLYDVELKFPFPHCKKVERE